jgi:hypothetical protein
MNNNNICKKCGAENAADSKFCMSCGEVMEPSPVQAEEVGSTPWQSDNNGSNPYYNTADNSYNTTGSSYDFTQPSYQTEEPFNPNAQSKGLSIAAMVCGIISIVGVCCYIGLPVAIVALVLGIIALVKKYGGRGMAIAGVVTGCVGLIINVLFWIFVVIIGVSDGFSSFYNYY